MTSIVGYADTFPKGESKENMFGYLIKVYFVKAKIDFSFLQTFIFT